MINLQTQEGRKALLESIDTSKNTAEYDRIKQSRKECDILEGHIEKYVIKELQKFRSPETVKTMQIVSDINIAKKIVKRESCVYQVAPERKYHGIDAQDERLERLSKYHEEAETNKKLKRANKLFRLQSQTFLYRYIENKSPKTKAFKKHQIRVAHIEVDGAIETVYIIPNYKLVNANQDEEAKRKASRYTIWSDSYNFIMDGEGTVTSGEDLSNPLKICPIIDIFEEKDESFWVKENRNLAEFTVWLNAAFSNLTHICEMQGFAVGTIKGLVEALGKIETQTIGTNYFTKLPKVEDSNGNIVDTEIEYLSPNAPITELIEAIKARMFAFFSCEDVEGAVNLDGKKEGYSSGWDRLLALIEEFEASRDDMDLFRKVEKKLWKIDKAYLSTYFNNDKVLEKDFYISDLDKVEQEIIFAEPEMIETQKEKEERIAYRVEKGWMTQKAAIMEICGVSEEDAEKIMEERAQEVKKYNNTVTPKVEQGEEVEGEQEE